MGRVARILLSARSLINYHRSNTRTDFTLDGALREDGDLTVAFAILGIDVFMTTVIDGVGSSDCFTPNALSPPFYTQEDTEGMEQEYSAFVFLPFEMFHCTASAL